MGAPNTDIKTSDTLLRALREAASKKPSLKELKEQRVSFVMGSVSDTNKVTREQVRQILDEEEGQD